MINFLERRRSFAILMTLLVAVQIFYFSTLQLGPGSETFSWLAIAYHFCVFFLFNFFLAVSIVGKKNLKVKDLVAMILISTVYSFSDEFHQMFVPGRNSSINDLIVDLGGILFSTVVYSYNKEKIK